MENCSFCGKLTDPQLENCPHCGGPMRAKTIGEAPAASAQRCPSCSAPIQDGDIICTRCGTNLLTGHKIAEEYHHESAPPPQRRWQPLAFSALALALVLALGALIYYLSLDPVASALSLAQSGNTLQATEQLENYVAEHTERADAWRLLGRLYWQSNQRPQAAQAFAQASFCNPQDVQAGFLAVVAAGSNAKGEALTEQLDALKRLVEHHPENMRAWYLLALLKGKNGDFAGQEAALKKALALEPSDQEAQQYMAVAQALGGNLDEAAVSMRQVSSSDDPTGDATAASGFIAYLQGQEEAAASFFEAALAENASIASHVRTRLALLYMGQGEFERALPLLRQAKEAQGATDAATFYHALCLEASGLEPEALIAYDRLVNAAKGYAGAAALQMAGIYLEQGTMERASEMLRKALQLDGSSARLSTLEGRIRFFQEDRAGAQNSFNEAIRLDPAYAPAHLELGLLYVSENNLKDGIRSLNRYLERVQLETEGARVNEVELLVGQLQQAVDSESVRRPNGVR